MKSLQELFSDPSRWTQGISARDARGYATYISNPAARSWCLWGGCVRIYGGTGPIFNEIFKKLEQAVKQYTGEDDSSPTSFNDRPTTSIEDIQAVVKLAGV